MVHRAKCVIQIVFFHLFSLINDRKSHTSVKVSVRAEGVIPRVLYFTQQMQPNREKYPENYSKAVKAMYYTVKEDTFLRRTRTNLICNTYNTCYFNGV